MIAADKKIVLLEHRPQLDGVRFCAVFVVMIYHHFQSLQGQHRFFDITTFIFFFFVLSGYLITKILILAKDIGAQQGQKKLKIAFDFLFRRTLRIFPAYYVYLFIMMLLPVGGLYLRNHAAMFFTYLSNFQIYKDQIWEKFATPHLWTLAVEEQFYILWPWLILFVPNKFLPKLFLILIAAGIIFRFLFALLVPGAVEQNVPLTVLTPSCLDGFGYGALLAYWHVFGKLEHPWLNRIFYAIIPLYILMSLSGTNVISITLGRIFVGIFGMFCIEGSVNGFKNTFGKIIGSKPFVYLGQISYGLYLYHLFASIVFWKIIAHIASFGERVGLNLTPLTDFLAIPLINFFMYIGTTIGLASASWYLLEKPVNRLRRRISNAFIQKGMLAKNRS
ncbi:MAG: acyltransferase [Bacteroidetes bacterium]|nr:acyltransferase [Bacteroidota bacterium]